ncbi:MAG: bifunctional DNA-formamidopyrimidine glycosylase/DNA-(apurinic or apyrimidinic site) lyase [bacterium]|nr:bifunctional DNA-formamidopyrimidine glycosylase/DNA-(apurinic or apyrimidinic site) lyase [bacterium]
MPELPEIETIKRDLEKKIIGKKIAGVEVREKKIVHPNPKVFATALTGNKFTKIDRRGKLLIFHLVSPPKFSSEKLRRARPDKFLLAHMKMTGQLVYRYDHKTIYGGHDVPKTITTLPNNFTRVIFRFQDKSILYFNDMRKFGYLKIVSGEVKNKILATRFGPDAFTPKLSLRVLKEVLEKRDKSSLKAVLMDQQSIAGIGNIYADEICFMAGLLPQRKINTLDVNDVKRLHNCIGHVLAHAVRHRGTTFGTRTTQNYVDSEGKHGNYLDFLKVYQRDGEKCLKCKKVIIQKDITAGRGTRFCKICQK